MWSRSTAQSASTDVRVSGTNGLTSDGYLSHVAHSSTLVEGLEMTEALVNLSTPRELLGDWVSLVGNRHNLTMSPST